MTTMPYDADRNVFAELTAREWANEWTGRARAITLIIRQHLSSKFRLVVFFPPHIRIPWNRTIEKNNHFSISTKAFLVFVFRFHLFLGFELGAILFEHTSRAQWRSWFLAFIPLLCLFLFQRARPLQRRIKYINKLFFVTTAKIPDYTHS